MKRILATLAFIVALAGGSVLLAGSSQKAGSPACCDPTCCEGHKSAATSCAKNEQVASVSSAPSCSTE
jgi:hypothetical protein